MTPSNLYELCEQVCETIELAPLQYYQGNWASSVEQLRRIRSVSGASPIADDNACGTVFCRAGHMCAILDAAEGKQPVPYSSEDALTISNRATDLLLGAGIPQDDISDLFYGGACRGSWGDARHADDGISGMRKFMANHASKLKAAKL